METTTTPSLVFILSILFWGIVSSRAQYGSLQSSYSQHDLWLRPYEWTYLRVEVPEWFSSVTMNFLSNIDIDREKMNSLTNTEVPVICLKDGNPPIPDLSDTYLNTLLSSFRSNGSNESLFAVENYSSDLEQCVPFQTNLTLIFTNEQISPGTYYVGYFNGLGPTRTQSKMISRGKSYKITTNIYTSACPISSNYGPNCNFTIQPLSCAPSNSQFFNSILCSASNDSSCLNQTENYSKLYYLDINSISTQYIISLKPVQNNNSNNNQSLQIRGFVRYETVPAGNEYDYVLEISGTQLVLEFPKIGRWYVLINAIINGTTNDLLCFNLDWQIISCSNGNVGTNCSYNSHILERNPKRNPAIPFDSYYVPKEGPTDSSSFPLQNLLTNYSSNSSQYTIFFLNIPNGAAGSLIHVSIKSIELNNNFELFAKFGGLPLNNSYDYYSIGNTVNGNPVILSYNGTGNLEMFIVYAREGIWSFALKHPDLKYLRTSPYMYVSLIGCYKGCSDNGACKYSVDESGLTFYSYCACDRDHGGFDCSDILVTPKGHVWQSIFLVASNAAAILPAFWALRQKAFAEWILYTSSGISSALYHACDVGTWCILSFRVLQFLDFWLSFMAVISTFIYMATINETSKRALHAGVFILTAILAATGATRTSNIGVVIAIGFLGLLIGWLLEFNQVRRFVYWSQRLNFRFHLPEMYFLCENVRNVFWNLLEALKKRFKWSFFILGFVFLALAGMSWKLESNKDYWIWHSCWHITIYTSSFFFLCSTRNNVPNYELARQNSNSRVDIGES
ncbi:hypothetical protein LUZ60_015088 [Juncus effusus]|nr:hypothetical protein LUZ60_015088 [Juncus effusus]